MVSEYTLENIEFNGKGYYRKHRKVIKGSTTGIIHVSKRLIGQDIDFIIIPKDVPMESSNE